MMITILISFTGYPDETKYGVEFRENETIKEADYPKPFIDMIINKGLAARHADVKGETK